MTDTTTTGDKTFTIKDIEAERAHAQHFKQQYEELSGKYKGIDPEKYAQAMQELDSLKNKDAAGDPKKLDERIAEKEREIADRFQSQLTTTQQERDAAKQELKHERATKPTLTKIATLVTGEDQALLLEPVIKSEADLVDGKVVFLGQDGKPRYSKTKPAELMSIDEYTEELKGRFPGSFKAETRNGAMNGAESTKGGGSNGKVLTMSEISKMPDGGKAYMANLAKTDKQALERLVDGR
jgi:rubrerythrin